MSAYIFKNLLIVERSCKYDEINKITQKSNWNLKPPQLFEYSSNKDKVIICYSHNMNHDLQTRRITTLTATPIGLQDGAIHLLVDGSSLKVAACNFPIIANALRHLISFKGYLQNYVNSSNYDSINLYWSPHIINNSSRPIILNSGLLTKPETLSHEIQKVLNFSQTYF